MLVLVSTNSNSNLTFSILLY